MGMIFLYIHIPHIFFISFPHNRHKQTIPAGSPVPCLFIYSLSAYISLVGFFSRRLTLRSCFRFRPRRPVFRRGPRCGGLRFAFTGLPPRRLVGRAVVRVVPYRSVPFLVSSGVSWGVSFVAPFRLAVGRLVISIVLLGVPFVVRACYRLPLFARAIFPSSISPVGFFICDYPGWRMAFSYETQGMSRGTVWDAKEETAGAGVKMIA